MPFFNKLNEPVFLKEDSSAYKQLNSLKTLCPELNLDGQELIKQEIRNLEYGISGEENIIFELKNSHMPMYVLRDIYLEFNDLNAQIDFMVFTRKHCFIIECKNLYGSIEITDKGEFIRNISYGKNFKKEGIYSPITQNQRHMDLLRKLRNERQKNFIMKKLVDSSFDAVFRSVVVLANPKTYLLDRYAKKEVKKQVIRADQLIAYIKEACKNSKEPERSDKELEAWAKRYLEYHKESKKEYLEKFQIYRQDNPVTEKEKKNYAEDMKEELRSYRWEKSKEEKVKPYFLFNDRQLEDLIAKMPKNLVELQQISGFGVVKAEKYGNDILEIILRYENKN